MLSGDGYKEFLELCTELNIDPDHKFMKVDQTDDYRVGMRIAQAFYIQEKGFTSYTDFEQSNEECPEDTYFKQLPRR
jgi:hypothetical protein